MRGSGGFAWADPATGESGAAGFFPDLRIGDCAVCEGTLYITGETSEEGTPGYGVYTAALEKGPDGMERIELEAGEPLLFRAGSGEFSTVIAEEGALLLHEWRGAEGESGRVQRLVRLDIATGEETVLAESICNTWTARSAGNYLIVRQEGEELRPLLLDESGEEREIALPEAARTAESVPAGALLGLDWTSEAGERTLSLIEPETGEIARSAAVPPGWSRCLGTDGERLYFWDSAKPDETSLLVALDLETLEACTPFA